MSANRPRSMRVDCPHCGTEAGKDCPHTERKACGHVGECNCGKPCECGRPGCVIPAGKRRHATRASKACRQHIYESHHQADTMTIKEAGAAEDGFWSGIAAMGRPTLAMGGQKRQKASERARKASS